MASLVASGIVALAGAVVGGSFTLAAQAFGDRRARARAEWNDHRQHVTAPRLNVLDLKRSAHRLERMKSKDDGRGFTELPRGAWKEYRAVLARRLPDDTFDLLEDASSSVIGWNEIVWAGYAERPPDYMHGSDQNPPGKAEATRLLDERYASLVAEVRAARRGLESLLLEQAGRPESEFMHLALHRMRNTLRPDKRRIGRLHGSKD